MSSRRVAVAGGVLAALLLTSSAGGAPAKKIVPPKCKAALLQVAVPPGAVQSELLGATRLGNGKLLGVGYWVDAQQQVHGLLELSTGGPFMVVPGPDLPGYQLNWAGTLPGGVTVVAGALISPSTPLTSALGTFDGTTFTPVAGFPQIATSTGQPTSQYIVTGAVVGNTVDLFGSSYDSTTRRVAPFSFFGTPGSTWTPLPIPSSGAETDIVTATALSPTFVVYGGFAREALNSPYRPILGGQDLKFKLSSNYSLPSIGPGNNGIHSLAAVPGVRPVFGGTARPGGFGLAYAGSSSTGGQHFAPRIGLEWALPGDPAQSRHRDYLAQVERLRAAYARSYDIGISRIIFERLSQRPTLIGALDVKSPSFQHVGFWDTTCCDPTGFGLNPAAFQPKVHVPYEHVDFLAPFMRGAIAVGDGGPSPSARQVAAWRVDCQAM